uniref:4-hydroxybutyrate coenzyme A transferase n=1 Tax=Cacopsylla melanoneura TaxID=428564 RepID=A0A8D9FGN7_9HEMI
MCSCALGIPFCLSLPSMGALSKTLRSTTTRTLSTRNLSNLTRNSTTFTSCCSSISIRNATILTKSPSTLTRCSLISRRNTSILTRNPSVWTRNQSNLTRNASILTRNSSKLTRFSSISIRNASILTRSPSILNRTSSILTNRRHPYSTSTSPIKLISKDQAVQLIKPNSVVFVEGVAGTPKLLMNAMYDHIKSKKIQGVTVLDVFSLYPYDNMTLDDDCVRRLSFFVSPYTRQFVNKGKAEYIPIMLNDLPLVFDHGYYSPDVALISVSPPDSSGYVSLGTNVTELHSVIQSSKLVVAQINNKMPRSLGDALVHVNQIDYGVEVSYDLFEPASEPVTDVDTTIANLICDQLIEDEATLQIGIGKIPEAILTNIKSHKNLGMHTELLFPGVLGLIKSGIINNSKKTIDPNQITATLLLGNKALYEFVNNNELIQMKRVTYSNNPAIIRQNHRMTAINTCLEIDLTGQVVSDSLGTNIYSGFGGQVDFMRGALTGLDGRGKAILAFASTDEKSGESKIVPTLKRGAGVVCSRAHVNYIVTEYGIADLFAKTTRQRAHLLIQLAHPRHREALEREAFDILGVMPCE